MDRRREVTRRYDRVAKAFHACCDSVHFGTVAMLKADRDFMDQDRPAALPKIAYHVLAFVCRGLGD